MNELVSVIVPVYRVEKYIKKCVDSVLGQSYENLEVILVDDGSPDSCGSICDEYAKADKRVVVIHKENGGLSSARNAALDIAKGDYVLCVDSDDYIHPDMTQRMLDAAKEYQADIVMSSYFIDSTDKLSITDAISDDVVEMGRMKALDRLVEDAEVKNYAWGKLYRRELFDGVRYPDGRNYEDIATTYLLFDKAQKIIKIPEYLYYYVVRDESISFNNSTASWHAGCHASCLGQEERAEYFLQKGYEALYEKAMAKLLPYLYSDIKSAYEADKSEDAEETKEYLRENREKFVINSMVSQKDKKLLDVYIQGHRAYELYDRCKKTFQKVSKEIRKTRKKVDMVIRPYNFKLAKGRTRRIVYFELPCFDNLGDHAIACATANMLEELLLEDSKTQLFVVPGWVTENAIMSLRKHIGKRDVIVCQGGGNFGSLYEFAQLFRRKVLSAFKGNKIVIMPQTVFYEDNDNGRKELAKDKRAIAACRDITIFARDARSYELFKEYFDAKALLTHDIVTQLEVENEGAGSVEAENEGPEYDGTERVIYEEDGIDKEWDGSEREGILLCLRSDKESSLTAEQKAVIMRSCEESGVRVKITDTCTNTEFSDDSRERILNAKLRLWQRSRLVVTDRLHGMIFALITKTPCIVIGNNHHKVQETYNTIRDCDYIFYLDSCDELDAAIKKILDMKPGNLKRPDYSSDIDTYREIIRS